MSKAIKVIAVITSILASAAVGSVIATEAYRLRSQSAESTPQVYVMQFGPTINKFIVLGNRLHLIVPLPVTGESGRIIEIDKISKKERGK